MKILQILITGFLCVLSLASGAEVDRLTNGIIVNDTGISRMRVQAMTDQLINQRGVGSGGITQPHVYANLQDRVVEDLIKQELLWQQAKRLNIQADKKLVDEEYRKYRETFDSDFAFENKLRESWFNVQTFRDDLMQRMSISKLLKQEVEDKLEISEDDIKAFYDENQDRMRYPMQMRASHILIRADITADEGKQEEALKHIKSIEAAIRGGADFAEQAREYSQDGSAEQGGDLGPFTTGMMVKEFEEAAMALEPGEMSGPVKTAFGYHLIKLAEKSGGGTASLDEARDQIREFLKRGKLNNAIVDYIERLRDEADIEILQ